MVASLSSLSTSPCHLPLLPGSLLPSHPLWKCAELPASYAFPYFVTFVSVLPSAWNASSIFQPPLMTDSCIPPPRPLLFSTRIVGKVIYLKKKKQTYFTWHFLYDNFLKNFPWNATKFANFYLYEIPDTLC